MEDMLRKTNEPQPSRFNGEDSPLDLLGELLREHKGQDVIVLDLRKISDWTDFFIIATVSSKTHMDGLERHIKEFCRENDLLLRGSSRKNPEDDWRLLDLGFAVIHLMSKQSREFYELERLWSK